MTFSTGKTTFMILLLLGMCSVSSAFHLSMNLGKITSSKSSGSTTITDRRTFISTSAAVTAAAGTTMATMSHPFISAAAASEEDKFADFTTSESGLKYKVVKEGNGTIPPQGSTVKTQYTGWLDDFESMRKFDSSRDRGRTFNFRVGAGQVIRGWDETFSTMSIGERRLIIVPARLGYGDRGAGGIIPGGATLYFDVELVGIL